MSRSGIKGVVPLDKMASEIAKTLTDWSQEVDDAMRVAVIEASAEAVRDLKRNSPKDTGAYARDWTRSILTNSRFNLRYVVHNKHHYRLTHLLEDGHANARGGGRTPAYPHIGLAEARAQDYLMEKARQELVDID